MIRWEPLAGALALALLTACATTPRPAPELTGRLALRIEAHAGAPARSLSTQFELRGDAQAGSLQLTTPLGSTAAQARWRPGLAEFITSEGTSRFADLDALAENLLGESLPLAALVEWLRGRPWPGAPSAARDNGFEQLGWRIDLSRLAEGWVLAGRDRTPALSVRARLEKPE
ncbi:MAG: outer membrane lipoprotein LolB [Burkholderiaceae bacterium]|nr:outer membrane lipoprotein LolB [Burkholderiaceae bacterium]